MVRTKADCSSTRVTAAKAPRKTTGGGMSRPTTSAAGSPAGKGCGGGGNAYNPQPVPKWQRGIANFLSQAPKCEEGADASSEGAGPSDDAPSSDTSSSSKACRSLLREAEEVE